jgi:hypothetical protein
VSEKNAISAPLIINERINKKSNKTIKTIVVCTVIMERIVVLIKAMK